MVIKKIEEKEEDSFTFQPSSECFIFVNSTKKEEKRFSLEFPSTEGNGVDE